jgi:DNA-binding response OmpR family regulator
MDSKRILVIEDSPERQETLKNTFEREGWKLTRADSGEEEAPPPGGTDYVILNIMLPVQDSLKVLKKLRKLENCQTLSVIMCTAQEEKTGKPAVLEHGKIKIDVGRHAAFLDGAPLDLSATEFTILTHFMKNPGIVFTRQDLLAVLRGANYQYPAVERSVDAQIMELRRKLKEYGETIETVRGVGYRFRN